MDVTDRIEVLESELSSLAIEAADLVIANLTAAVLSRYAFELKRLVRSGGALVVSGFGPDESAAVAASLPPFVVQRQAREGEWVALLLM